MICVSMDEQYDINYLKALTDISFAEIRMDCMDLTVNDIGDIFSQPVKFIATCRPGFHDDCKRKEYLIAAIEAGAKYVDIEVESDIADKREIMEKARSRGCKVIMSFHDYDKTPDSEKLEQIAALCFSEGADIAKIACKVNYITDSARLIGLLGQEDFKDRLVVVGMGEKGKITRIAGPFLGSLFTYASPAENKSTADGQIEKKRLENIMRSLTNG